MGNHRQYLREPRTYGVKPMLTLTLFNTANHTAAEITDKRVTVQGMETAVVEVMQEAYDKIKKIYEGEKNNDK